MLRFQMWVILGDLCIVYARKIAFVLSLVLPIGCYQASAQGNNDLYFDDWVEITASEISAIWIASGGSVDEIEEGFFNRPDLSENPFEYKRERKKVMDNVRKLSVEYSQYDGFLFFRRAVPVKFSDYDFNRKVFFLCVPSTFTFESPQWGLGAPFAEKLAVTLDYAGPLGRSGETMGLTRCKTGEDSGGNRWINWKSAEISVPDETEAEWYFNLFSGEVEGDIEFRVGRAQGKPIKWPLNATVNYLMVIARDEFGLETVLEVKLVDGKWIMSRLAD